MPEANDVSKKIVTVEQVKTVYDKLNSKVNITSTDNVQTLSVGDGTITFTTSEDDNGAKILNITITPNS